MLLSLALIVGLVIGMYWLAFRSVTTEQRIDIPADACPNCSYSLRDLPAVITRCPECGADFDPASIQRDAPPPVNAASGALAGLVILAGPALAAVMGVWIAVALPHPSHPDEPWSGFGLGGLSLLPAAWWLHRVRTKTGRRALILSAMFIDGVLLATWFFSWKNAVQHRPGFFHKDWMDYVGAVLCMVLATAFTLLVVSGIRNTNRPLGAPPRRGPG